MENEKLHIVNVGPGGTFQDSGELRSTPEEVGQLIDHLRAQSVRHVVLHLHGGLIDESAGLAIARKVAPAYEAAGAYPLALVWETGLGETWKHNLLEIHETKLFKKLLKLACKVVARKLGLDAGIGLESVAGVEPPSFEEDADKLEGALFFQELERAAADSAALEGLETVAPEVTEADLERWIAEEPGMEAALGDQQPPQLNWEKVRDPQEEGLEAVIFSWARLAASLARVGLRATTRLLRQRGHGAYCTIVEEVLREIYVDDLGQWTWGQMKEKAEEMFRPNDGLSGVKRHAGRELMDGLATLQREPGGLIVDVVGHSAGSIAACRLLEAMAGRLKVRKIAFLAPAVRTEVAHATLFTQPTRFESFRMFTMSDAFEIKDPLFKKVYPRSLLYFISGVLEPSEVDETILGMERHLTGRSPYDEDHLVETVNYLTADPARTVWSVTDDGAPAGRRSTSTSHGGFDDDPATMDSLTAWLGEGIEETAAMGS